MLGSMLTLWEQTQPFSVLWGQRLPCEQISITPDGWMVNVLFSLKTIHKASIQFIHRFLQWLYNIQYSSNRPPNAYDTEGVWSLRVFTIIQQIRKYWRLIIPLPADPTFIRVHLIPDSAERNDDKLYFFFREKSSEMGQSPVTQSRIGRICLVCTQRRVCLF